MVLALCILGVAAVTLLLIAMVDRPTQRLTRPGPVPLAQVRMPQEALPTSVGATRDAVLDPYVMR